MGEVLALKYLPAIRLKYAELDADILLLVPRDQVRDISKPVRARLSEAKVRVVESPWATPPGMLYRPSGGWCGPKDLIKLHAFALEGYDAVVYLHGEAAVEGDILPALKCAATGKLLVTGSGGEQPLDLGFFAAKPDPRLVLAAMALARLATFSRDKGWADAGFAPHDAYYLGAECGAGFLHTLLFKAENAVVQKARREAGMDEVGALEVLQLDMCEWNYQHSWRCPGFTCSLVRVHQRPLARGSDPAECLKQRPASNWLHPNCRDCCNNGTAIVSCLDVELCAQQGPAEGKWAFVLSHYGVPKRGGLHHLAALRQEAQRLRADLLMLVTRRDAKIGGRKLRARLEEVGVRLVEVDWAIPPAMRFRPSGGWCGGQDLIRLHAFALTAYDAVAYYDDDIEIQGDLLPLLRCAATGRLLTTMGGIGEPVNVGFFAVRPDPRVLEASLAFARAADFQDLTGWAGAGYYPSEGRYVGAECGQGFWHTLFYKTHNDVSRAAWVAGGLLAGDGPALQAAQVDICEWNYQLYFNCGENFDCKKVRAHHKPNEIGDNPKECTKRNLAAGRPRAPTTPAARKRKRLPGCQECCNDGEERTPCLEDEALDDCAARGPAIGKYAFVLVYEPLLGFRDLPHVGSMRAFANSSLGAGTFELLVVASQDAQMNMKGDLRRALELHGATLIDAAWARPDALQIRSGEEGRGCAAREMLGPLVAMNLSGFDAVVYYASEVEVQGDLMPIFRCAASGRVLATGGGFDEPMSPGFLALRPDSRWLHAALAMLREATYTDDLGWAEAGYLPKNEKYGGAECGAGFMHALFFKPDSDVVQQILQRVGLQTDGARTASMIDMCLWNYQHSMYCEQGFDCKRVRAHARPQERGNDPNECMKLALQKSRKK